jgi:hypothetical protein
VAASKPISWTHLITTSLISLNNNFGTLLTLVLGCFPLDIQPYRTMSDYSTFRIISDIFAIPIRQHSDRVLADPPMCTKQLFCQCVNYVPAKILFELPT